MRITRIDEFERGGRRFTLYEGGSYILFEEDDEGAEGIGMIEPSGTGLEATVWRKPGAPIAASTLQEAVEGLVVAALTDDS